MENQVHCPKCNSTQLSANKKGFSGRKAVAGAIATGGIGLLAGTIGSNKIIITCLNCGNQFKPGEQKISSDKPLTPNSLRINGMIMLIFGILFSLIGLLILISGGYIFGAIILLIGIIGISMYISNRKWAKSMEDH